MTDRLVVRRRRAHKRRCEEGEVYWRDQETRPPCQSQVWIRDEARANGMSLPMYLRFLGQAGTVEGVPF